MATSKWPARKPLSKRVRFEVFKRDSFTCQYCGAHPPAVILHVDHIKPVAEGGRNDIDNLVTACQPCNSGKSDVPLSSVPASLKEKTALIAESEAQLKGFHEVMEAKNERVMADAWAVAEQYIEHFKDDGIEKDRLASIKLFNEKLGFHDCLDSMERALLKIPSRRNDAFRYFCGVCWVKIRDQQ